MPKLLIFGNFELSFDSIEEGEDSDKVIQKKEAEILRLLRKATENNNLGGSVESFEFESFVYAHEDYGEPDYYYYNKYDTNHETI